MYELDFTEQSQKEIAKLRKSDAQAYKKLKLLLAELREHPYIGTGHRTNFVMLMACGRGNSTKRTDYAIWSTIQQS